MKNRITFRLAGPDHPIYKEPLQISPVAFNPSSRGPSQDPVIPGHSDSPADLARQAKPLTEADKVFAKDFADWLLNPPASAQEQDPGELPMQEKLKQGVDGLTPQERKRRKQVLDDLFGGAARSITSAGGTAVPRGLIDDSLDPLSQERSDPQSDQTMPPK